MTGMRPGLNFEVTRADALPTLGRSVEWETIHDKYGIVIEVAAKEPLLAMKLRANRPGRDTRDIRLLLSLCGLETLDEAEARGEYVGHHTRGVVTLVRGETSGHPFFSDPQVFDFINAAQVIAVYDVWAFENGLAEQGYTM